jgi:hypothetical protein
MWVVVGQEAQEQVNKVLQEYAGSVAGTGDAVELLNLYCGADVMEVLLLLLLPDVILRLQ